MKITKDEKPDVTSYRRMALPRPTRKQMKQKNHNQTYSCIPHWSNRRMDTIRPVKESKPATSRKESRRLLTWLHWWERTPEHPDTSELIHVWPSFRRCFMVYPFMVTYARGGERGEGKSFRESKGVFTRYRSAFWPQRRCLGVYWTVL